MYKGKRELTKRTKPSKDIASILITESVRWVMRKLLELFLG